jgi:Amt family ammonium transporter
MDLLGCYATRAVNPTGGNGLFTGGGLHLFGWEVLAALITAAYCFGAIWVLSVVVDKVLRLRVTPEVEFDGLDLAHHAESAYSMGGSGRIGG